MDMGFKPFSVKVLPPMCYWEDEATGLMVKRDQTVNVVERHARSNELRFALLRSRLLVVEGSFTFAFKENVLRVEPGRTKNLITILEGPGKGTQLYPETNKAPPVLVKEADVVVPEPVKQKVDVHDESKESVQKKKKHEVVA